MTHADLDPRSIPSLRQSVGGRTGPGPVRGLLAAGLLAALVSSPLLEAADLTGRDRSGSDSSRQIDWVATYDEALTLARKTGRPLFIALNKDGEEACDAMLTESYRDQRLVRLARDAVALIANPDDHDDPALAADEQGHRPCPRFGRVSCAEHQAVMTEVMGRWFKGQPSVVVPQHILAGADETPIAIREYYLEAIELRQLVDEAVSLPTDPARATLAHRKRLEKKLKNLSSGPKAQRELALADLMLALTRGRLELAMEVVDKRANSKVRMQVARALGEQGATADQALSRFLADRSPAVRLAAIEAYGASPHYLKAARSTLVTMQETERSRKVRQAIEAVL